MLRAIQLYEKHREWTRVLRELAEEGNGTWARNTLIRRTSSSAPARVQNPSSRATSSSSSPALLAVSKTHGGRSGIKALGELERAVEREAYNTPAYHQALAALHTASGPCGCYSCGTTKKGRRAA